MSQTHFLAPSKLRLRESADGGLLLDMDGQTVALGTPKRAMPISDPDRYIVLSNTDGEEIGVVRAVADLDPHSRAVLEAMLKRTYVMERITRVLEVEKEALSGQTRWRVEIAISEQEMEDTRPLPSIFKRALGGRASGSEETSNDNSNDKSSSLQKVRWLRRQSTPVEGEDDGDDDNTEVIVSRVVTEEREFCISGQEDVKTARYPQIFIVDTEGHHYEIPNCEELDLASRRAAERFI